MIRASYRTIAEIMGFYTVDDEPLFVPVGSVVELVQENDDAGFVFMYNGQMCTTTNMSVDVLQEPQDSSQPTEDQDESPYTIPVVEESKTRKEAVQCDLKKATKERVKITYDRDEELMLLF